MGIETTYDIQRQDAINLLMAKILQCDDRELEGMLYAMLIEKHIFYNYKVVDAYDSANEHNYPAIAQELYASE